jgi:hypothetical protein
VLVLIHSRNVSRCARPGCFNKGVNRCTSCLREPYCSGDCQKDDWKSHKLICKILKTLSNKKKPFHEVGSIIQRTWQNEHIKISTRLLGHLLSYAEFQFGNHQFGISYRERDGERVSNFVVELAHLIPMYKRYTDICERDRSISELIRNNSQFS